jgi:hypothetical protein
MHGKVTASAGRRNSTGMVFRSVAVLLSDVPGPAEPAADALGPRWSFRTRLRRRARGARGHRGIGTIGRAAPAYRLAERTCSMPYRPKSGAVGSSRRPPVPRARKPWSATAIWACGSAWGGRCGRSVVLRYSRHLCPSGLECPLRELGQIPRRRSPAFGFEVPRGFRTVHQLGWTIWKGEVFAPT